MPSAARTRTALSRRVLGFVWRTSRTRRARAAPSQVPSPRVPRALLTARRGHRARSAPAPARGKPARAAPVQHNRSWPAAAALASDLLPRGRFPHAVRCMQGAVMSGAPVRRACTPCVPHRVRSRASQRGHGSRRRRAGKSHVARPPRSAQRSRAAPRLPLQRGRCFSCAAKEVRGAPACGGGRELGAPPCAPSGAGGGRGFCFSPRGEGEALAAPTRFARTRCASMVCACRRPGRQT